ncbi:putative aminohydrolase SsnA [Vallitalea pronyensis]|uniref:Putative aminohydrolase SsnA n=1 Tax=Vallitalea pronyensis TaxID=1348613 RepID=A0A8J8ML28_9FIRM|nr:putative aminohydrolase SsnA [Vallitalea pronyensis]QUI23481.1 putative aminohydrolase SsnA [Vallitalea pronyensis]
MILIGNGRMITRDPNQPFIEDGCLVVDGPCISDVGSTDALRSKYPEASFVDAKGGLIMPGLINTHHHIYSALARAMMLNNHNPSNFLEILEGMWWKIDKHLTLEDVQLSAYVTYLECIKNGVTTVFDHHASYGATAGSLFEISEVAKKLGIRTSLCYEVSDRHGHHAMVEAVKENVDFIQAAKKDVTDMQKGMMGLHASFTLSDTSLDYIASQLPAETGYHVHVAEGIGDLHDALSQYNKRVVERLMDHEILGPDTLAIHCIHVNQREMDLLKETDTMVVHNPESNMGNAVGFTPVLELMRRDIPLGLGTDGYTSDMLESMKVANILPKHQLCNPSVAWGEVPQMLFHNNAAIANRFYNKPLGILKEGAYADVIIADYNPFTPLDGNNCNGHILFGLSGRHVTTTMINGKLVMKDRQVLGIDEEQLMAHSRELAVTLWEKMNR